MRGKAWILGLFLPMKLGLSGILIAFLVTPKSFTKWFLVGFLVVAGVLSLWVFSTFLGRLFAAGLIIQLMVTINSMFQGNSRKLRLIDGLGVVGLLFVVMYFGISRYSGAIAKADGLEQQDVIDRVVSDSEAMRIMMLDNFFDAWFTISAIVELEESGNATYLGKYHLSGIFKCVPGLYSTFDETLGFSRYVLEADLGERTTPYLAGAYLDFSWMGVIPFFLYWFMHSCDCQLW